MTNFGTHPNTIDTIKTYLLLIIDRLPRLRIRLGVLSRVLSKFVYYLNLEKVFKYNGKTMEKILAMVCPRACGF